MTLRDKIQRIIKLGPLVISGLALIVWLSLQQEGDTISAPTGVSIDAPDLTLIDSVTHHYDESGALKYKLTASKVDHYKETDIAFFEEPDLISYTPEHQWTAQSNTGKADLNTDIITLKDQVKITHTSSDQSLILRTSLLDIDTKQNTADNEVLSVLHTGASFVESKGFFSNLTTGETLLKSNVRGTYVVQN